MKRIMYTQHFIFGACAVAVVAAWLISSAGEDEGSSFHPFRSEESKHVYMEYYDKRAELFPGESILVSTSFGETHVRVSGPAATEGALPSPLCKYVPRHR